ncbi:hypothetical protein Pelo_2471 [Pelomyxa schiedti]|nr:hypothetical protein Pelo_2471 [Pelomyxa schiedti]
MAAARIDSVASVFASKGTGVLGQGSSTITEGLVSKRGERVFVVICMLIMFGVSAAVQSGTLTLSLDSKIAATIVSAVVPLCVIIGMFVLLLVIGQSNPLFLSPAFMILAGICSLAFIAFTITISVVLAQYCTVWYSEHFTPVGVNFSSVTGEAIFNLDDAEVAQSFEFTNAMVATNLITGSVSDTDLICVAPLVAQVSQDPTNNLTFYAGCTIAGGSESNCSEQLGLATNDCIKEWTVSHTQCPNIDSDFCEEYLIAISKAEYNESFTTMSPLLVNWIDFEAAADKGFKIALGVIVPFDTLFFTCLAISVGVFFYIQMNYHRLEDAKALQVAKVPEDEDQKKQLENEVIPSGPVDSVPQEETDSKGKEKDES